MNVGLVACCAGKRGFACEAQHLYCSPLFMLSASAARTLDDWGILSAKHGLVLPREVLAPYEETLNDMPELSRKEWAAKTSAALRKKWPAARFVVFAGDRYQSALDGFDWVDALRGLPIGKRLKALKEGTWTR